MHLTMRSQLLFEAPATAAAQTHSSGSSSSGAAVAQAAAGAGDVKQQQDRRHSAWDGAVDLNPGFHFRPGAKSTSLRMASFHSKMTQAQLTLTLLKQ
jgi:hypothetical protein